MDYKQKYIKYKNKYLQLKKFIGGFNKIDYIYHGTNSFYINYILDNGLTGQYPPELFSLLEELYTDPIFQELMNQVSSMIQERSKLASFFTRQKDIKQRRIINISFSTHIEHASLYGSKAQNKFLGEGPGILITYLEKILKLYDEKKIQLPIKYTISDDDGFDEEEHVIETIPEDKITRYRFIKDQFIKEGDKQIILAKRADVSEKEIIIRTYEQDKYSEITQYRPIPPSELFLVDIANNNLIPLTNREEVLAAIQTF